MRRAPGCTSHVCVYWRMVCALVLTPTGSPRLLPHLTVVLRINEDGAGGELTVRDLPTQQVTFVRRKLLAGGQRPGLSSQGGGSEVL